MMNIQRPSHKNKFLRIVLFLIATLSLLYSSLGTLFTNPQAVFAASPWTQTDWSGGSGQISWSDSTKYSTSSDINDSTSGQLSLATNNQYQTHWGEGFKYRKKLTFNNSAQAENLANFPVLVKLTSSNFDFSKAQTNGQDIRFTDSDDSTTLSYEIEKWDAAGQEADIWVKVPQVDASSSTDFMYIYYGNPLATDGQDAEDVWDNGYVMVQHLNQTTGSFLDSTSNNNDINTYDRLSRELGQIDGAVHFYNNGGYLRVANTNDLKLNGDFTVEVWHYQRSNASGGTCDWYQGTSCTWPNILSQSEAWQIFISRPSGGLNFKRNGATLFLPSAVNFTGFQYLAFSYNRSGTELAGYVDGDFKKSGSYSYPDNTNSGDLFIGRSHDCCNVGNASVDEIRISKSTRSAAWIKAQYKSMTDTFITYDTETQLTWWGSAWKYREKITFDNSAQAENLVNFPVLVKLNSSRINYSLTKDSGEDVRFSDADGITTLPYEIEKWDETGDSFVWVKVPQIDGSSSADFIYIYYGNSSASDNQDAENVWDSNYKMVQHLDETSGTHYDSTSNHKDSTTVNVTAQGSAEGKIGGADEFNGTNNYIELPRSNLTDFTIQMWVKPPDTSTGCTSVAYAIGSNSDWGFYFPYYCTTAPYFITSWVILSDWSTGLSSFPDYASSNSWHLITSVRSGTSFTTYLDGVPGSTVTLSSSNPLRTGSGKDRIGHEADTDRYLKGEIDEVRISDTSRSGSWIKAQYASMNDTFNTYGLIEGQYEESSGVLTSSIFDTTQSSNWGTLTYNSSGTGTVAVKVRTSNSATMEGATDLGTCIAVSNGTDISTNNCVTDGERYVQYQVGLSTTDPNVTPVLEDITLAYDLNTSPTGSMVIASGASYTTTSDVALTLSATDDLDEAASLQMMLSDNSSFTGASWESFVPLKIFTLSTGDGTKTVYIKFKDTAGNVSEVYSDTIIYDSNPPSDEITINSNTTYTKTRDVTLTINAADALSGIYQMMISETADLSDGTWETYATTKSWTFSTGDGTKTIYIKFKDLAGNLSSIFHDSIILDTTQPAIVLLKLNGTDFTSDITTWEVTSTKPPFSGTTDPGATVTITITPGTTIGTVTADANGNWFWTSATDLFLGNYTVTIASTDLAGNTKSLSFTLEVKSVTAALPNTGLPQTLILFTILSIIFSGFGIKIIAKLRHFLFNFTQIRKN